MIKPRKNPRPGRLKGIELQELRLMCWRRDKGKCVKCGRATNPFAPQEWDNSYHMSHIKAKRMGGDKLANVETLCGEHHREFHNYGPSGVKPCPAKEQSHEQTVFSENGDAIPFEVSRKTATAAQSLNLLPYRETLGAAQGTIHSWYREAKPPYFVLRELSSRDLISCLYEPDDYPAIYKAMEGLEQVVHVHGIILSDTRKHKIDHIRVKNIILAEPFGYEDVEKFMRTNRAQ